MGSPHGQQPSHAQWSFYDYHDPDYQLDWKMSETSKPFRSVCIFMVGQKPNDLFLFCRISWKLSHHIQLMVKLKLYLNLDQSLTFYGARFCCVAFMFRSEKKSVSAAWVLLIAIPEAHLAYLNSYSSTAAWTDPESHWCWWNGISAQRVKQEKCRIFVSVKIWGIIYKSHNQFHFWVPQYL